MSRELERIKELLPEYIRIMRERQEREKREQETKLMLYSNVILTELWKPIIPNNYESEQRQLPAAKSAFDFSSSGILHNLQIPNAPGKYLIKYSQGDRSFKLKVKISEDGVLKFKARGRVRIW